MQDYSQSGEQPAILEVFKDANPGRFLDIGSWHPKQMSNTRALYELGWSGVMIEPSPRPLLHLLEEYGHEPRITIIEAAVTRVPGLVKMHITDDAVSTSSYDEYERWKVAAQFKGEMLVVGITLEQIAAQFGGFDFVNIDAEGLSADLCLRMLELGMFPPCICVEHDSRTVEILGAATKEHYRAVLVNAQNVVMAR